MTENCKAICRELLKLSYSQGFDGGYPLQPIAEALQITEPLYDENTGTGILWELGSYGNGLLDVSHDGKYAS